VRVGTIVVRPAGLDATVWTTGELRADEAVELKAEDEGRIVALHFREGQHVETGELLVKINDEDLQADLRRARVQKQLAQQRERRTRSLLEEHTVSQEIYDEARGQLEIVEANIESIEARIRKTEIKAPFSGTIGLRQVSEGSFVTSSQVIATLQSLHPIKLDFSVPEKYAADIHTGERVEFTVAGLDSTFRGEVYAREPRIDTATRTVRLRARAPNGDGKLLPGGFAKVRLVLDSAEEALSVPAIAIVPGLEATTVWVIEDGVASARQVEIGQRGEQQVEVTKGLMAGDHVVVSGVQQMRPGLAVEESVTEGLSEVPAGETAP
jgi:membrane fusion protein (multidrug efflux system)